MKDNDVRSIIATERQRFVHYVRSLIRETTEMDAEDVVHDVIISILERADLVRPDFPLAYIFRSLRNRVIDYSRTRKPTLSLQTEDREGGGKLIDLLQDVRPDILETMQTQEGKEDLFKALAKLNEMERCVIVGHELEGATFKQLAQRFELPINTLLSHKSRGMKKLRKDFLDQQGDYR